MPENTVNYAIQFADDLKQKYSRELLSGDLTTQKVKFVGANKVRIPYINMSGFKDHSRNGGFNSGSAENNFMEKELKFDRDIEFFVDEMDVDESNYALTAANVTNEFIKKKAIPETDCYRFSKLYADFVELGGVASTVALTAANILDQFDNMMMEMDDDEVPEEGRILYTIPTVYKLFKDAEKIMRTIETTGNNDTIKRNIKSLDDVKIKKIPSKRMMTAYDFSDGYAPAATAKQMNMILVHPDSIIAADKHSYIKLWPEGTHTKGDGWLYQTRKYGDLFVIDTRMEGIKINLAAE